MSNVHHTAKENGIALVGDGIDSDAAMVIASQPLSEFFQGAVEQNKLFILARKNTQKYTSPLFRLVSF